MRRVPFLVDGRQPPVEADTPLGRVSVSYSETLGAVLLVLRDQHGRAQRLDVQLTKVGGPTAHVRVQP